MLFEGASLSSLLFPSFCLFLQFHNITNVPKVVLVALLDVVDDKQLRHRECRFLGRAPQVGDGRVRLEPRPRPPDCRRGGGDVQRNGRVAGPCARQRAQVGGLEVERWAAVAWEAVVREDAVEAVYGEEAAVPFAIVEALRIGHPRVAVDADQRDVLVAEEGIVGRCISP